MTWLGQTSSIAVGIAGGVYLTGVFRAARWAVGTRLYAYAVRLRAEQASRRDRRRVAPIAETIEGGR